MGLFYAQKCVKLKKQSKHIILLKCFHVDFELCQIWSCASSALKTRKHWSAAARLLTNWTTSETASSFWDFM